MNYSKGSNNTAMVRQIQEALHILVDGVFGPATERAVVQYQMQNNLVADGVVGPKTLAIMGILDTDLRPESTFRTPHNLVIQKYYLPKGEYLEDKLPILNDYMILHHTAGWHNPFQTVDVWARDSRGAVATEFVIGGQDIRNGDAKYDGITVQTFPTGCAGWHASCNGSAYLNRHSVGVEICNFGQLDAQNRTYVGVKAHESQICTLDEAYKGYTKWHRYSDEQLLSLKKLILFIADRDNIDVRKGLPDWIRNQGSSKAFLFQQDAYEGKVKGLLSHANVNKQKFDMFPQLELIDMLLSL